MDTTDWRDQLLPDTRERIVNKILETLERHRPVSGRDELGKMAQRFEEKVFTAATSQSDYIRKISLKMATMETKSHRTMANRIPPYQAGPCNKSSDPGLVMPQVHNPGQQHPIPLPNPPPSRQQLISQNIQNNIASQPNLPPVFSLSQTPVQNVGQNPNMQNIPGQNSVGSSIIQNSNMQNMFAGSQRQMQGRQQVVPQQQQQQSHNPQQYMYLQQQQNVLQLNQLQSSQQSVMQTLSVMQQPSMMQTQQYLYQQEFLKHKLQLQQQQLQQQQQQLQQLQQLQLQRQQRLQLRQQQRLQLRQQQQLQLRQILALGKKQSSRGIRRPTWTRDYMN